MFKPTRRSLLTVGAASTAAVGLAACGGKEDSKATKGGVKGNFEERGPITFATGKDTSGKLKEFLEKWNSKHPDEKVTLVELPESADEQRSQFINNAQAKSDAYTVLGLDVVWTAEFAAQQWIVELPQDKFKLKELIPSTVETGKYFDRLYAIPFATNAELLFYRTDLVKAAGSEAAPATFDEMYELIEAIRKTPEGKDTLGFASQYSKYEGMTVQLTGLAASAGGGLFDKSGKPTANSAETAAGVQAVKDGFAKNYIPKEALTYKEEESRQAFQDGKLAFLQNWPYVYSLAQATDGSSKVSGKIGVAPIPGVGSGKGASALGGLNYAISATGKNMGTAVDFIAFMTDLAQQKEWTIATSQAPAHAAVYEDKDVLKAYPFFTTLKEAIDAGTSRPQVVKYGDVTQAIQEAGYKIFDGGDVKAELDTLQKALEGFAEKK